MADGLGALLGKGGVAEQIALWQVVSPITSTALTPAQQLLLREVNKALPSTPLSPADLADMSVRAIVAFDDAAAYARESGVNEADFRRLVQNAGEPLSLQQALEAQRRGLIPLNGSGPDSVSVEQVIRESRLFTKYTAAAIGLSDVPIGVADAVDAVVKGQIPYEQGVQIAYLSGVSEANFRILVDTNGNPPAPGELATLLKRGLIPLQGVGPDVLSFQQGIYEGRSKTKWWQLYARLADYVPPARTVVTLVRDGVVTDAEALVMFAEDGLSDDLARKYVQSAHQQRGAAHKATISTELRTVARRGYADGHFSEAQFRAILAQANLPADVIDDEVLAANISKEIGRHSFSLSQIKKQRQDGLIDDAQAVARLLAAGWSQEDAQAQVDEWNAEAKVGRTGLTESRILAYLKAGILTAAEAYDLLTAQGINSTNAKFLVDHPETVPAVRIHGNTPADIIAAYKDGILDLGQTRQKLIDAGDTADAADLKLQIAHFTLNRGPKPKLQHKNLTEAQVLEAFKLGLVADTWALRELSTMGYSDTDASLLVTIEDTKKAGSVPASWVPLT